MYQIITLYNLNILFVNYSSIKRQKNKTDNEILILELSIDWFPSHWSERPRPTGSCSLQPSPASVTSRARLSQIIVTREKKLTVPNIPVARIILHIICIILKNFLQLFSTRKNCLQFSDSFFFTCRNICAESEDVPSFNFQRAYLVQLH